MKCLLCSMEATYRMRDAQGVMQFYCDHHAPKGAQKLLGKPSVLKIYRPLIIVGIIIIAASLALSFWRGFGWEFFMQMFMGIFFLVFGVLKALTWKDFVPSFSAYDPLAKSLKFYGWLYPAIELALAVLFLAGMWLDAASLITIIILGITTVGIIGAMRRKETLQCVCLGKLLSLPLGLATVGENVIMIGMGLFMLAL